MVHLEALSTPEIKEGCPSPEKKLKVHINQIPRLAPVECKSGLYPQGWPQNK